MTIFRPGKTPYDNGQETQTMFAMDAILPF